MEVIKSFTSRPPDNVDRLTLRRAAHGLAELSKTGMQLGIWPDGTPKAAGTLCHDYFWFVHMHLLQFACVSVHGRVAFAIEEVVCNPGIEELEACARVTGIHGIV